MFTSKKLYLGVFAASFLLVGVHASAQVVLEAKESIQEKIANLEQSVQSQQQVVDQYRQQLAALWNESTFENIAKSFAEKLNQDEVFSEYDVITIVPAPPSKKRKSNSTEVKEISNLALGVNIYISRNGNNKGVGGDPLPGCKIEAIAAGVTVTGAMPWKISCEGPSLKGNNPLRLYFYPELSPFADDVNYLFAQNESTLKIEQIYAKLYKEELTLFSYVKLIETLRNTVRDGVATF